jgi:hypothetical protein
MAAVPVVALWAVLFLVSNLSLQYGARLPANIAAVIMLAEILVATFSAWMLGAAELRRRTSSAACSSSPRPGSCAIAVWPRSRPDQMFIRPVPA